MRDRASSAVVVERGWVAVTGIVSVQASDADTNIVKLMSRIVNFFMLHCTDSLQGFLLLHNEFLVQLGVFY